MVCVLRNHFILFVIEIHGCLHSHFDSFLNFCAQVTITRHQQKKRRRKFLQCLFLIIDYVSIAFQSGEAIAIFSILLYLRNFRHFFHTSQSVHLCR
jgi:hypothetical protein